MLTNAIVKAARPMPRAYKLADQRGLHLHVAPSGHRAWRMRFRVDGREQLLTFGAWPDVSLGDARARCEAAREQLRRGEDPRGRATTPAIAETFKQAARAWHAHQAPHWSPRHAADVLVSLERDVFPAIGAVELAAITRPTVLALLRAVEARGCFETARRLRQRISAVFEFAMSEGWCDVDPAAVVRRALQRPGRQRRQPALTTIEDARALLAAADGASGGRIVKAASLFLALTAVRLEALRGARWGEIEDLDGAAPVWRVPAARVKQRQAQKSSAEHDHLVPLAPAAVDVLRGVRASSVDRNRPCVTPEAIDVTQASLIFPGRAGEELGENTIGDLYDRAGYAGRHVPHGWRAAFSTILNDALPDERQFIDAALGHALKRDDGREARVESAYNRAQHLARRRQLFDFWAHILFTKGATVGQVGEIKWKRL